jgi:hypothetical protein
MQIVTYVNITFHANFVTATRRYFYVSSYREEIRRLLPQT